MLKKWVQRNTNQFDVKNLNAKCFICCFSHSDKLSFCLKVTFSNYQGIKSRAFSVKQRVTYITTAFFQGQLQFFGMIEVRFNITDSNTRLLVRNNIQGFMFEDCCGVVCSHLFDMAITWEKERYSICEFE